MQVNPNEPLPREITQALGISRHAGGGPVTWTFQKLTAEGLGGTSELHLIVFEHGNTTVAIPLDKASLRAFGEACITNATGLHIARPEGITNNGNS